MFSPSFTLQLKHNITPGTAAVGKYDGTHPCLTCGTSAAKVFIHNPHKPFSSGGRTAATDNDISLLNVNQTVTALCTGQLDQSLNRDILCIGSQTNLLAYDVHDNKDLFYKEVPDGVNKVIIGRVSTIKDPIAIAGGNCTLSGFDAKGNDKFWTVTGDVIRSMAFVNFSNKDPKELLVGSEDFAIRVFEFEEIIADMSETEAVTELCPLYGNRFGFGLSNGTVGVYDKGERLWRIKSKNTVMAMHAFDIDDDGEKELITGWSNGKVDARSNKTNDVFFKDTLGSAIAGLVDADYRMDGKNQLICCSVDGEVRGFQGNATKIQALADSKQKEDFQDLFKVKQNLLNDLKNIQDLAQPVEAENLTSTDKIESAAIPSTTQVDVKVNIETGKTSRLYLKVKTNTETVVRMVVIFAEALFSSGESLVVHPPADSVSDELLVPLHPTKDAAVDLHVHSFVTLPGGSQYHVFVQKVTLPKFSSYIQTTPGKDLPQSNVTFTVNERLERIVIWFSENFLLHQEIPCDKMIMVKFIALRGGEFVFKMTDNGKVALHTDNIDLAGDIIQSLASFLRLDNLQVNATFPIHLKKLSEIMETVESLHGVTQRLAAEMTDHANLIRSLVVRAEDARLQDDFNGMRKGFKELQDLNQDLLGGYQVRSTNHEELVKSLKLVNQLIQKASHLRVGKFQTQVITLCREAIKNNRTATLLKVIQAGSA